MISTSRARDASSRAREALGAVLADLTTKNLRVPEARAPAGGIPLVPAAPAVSISAAPVPPPAPAPGTSHKHPSSAVAVDAQTRRPGGTNFP